MSGHCRRRKIRCIPAPGDHQNRCSNCIRLKKECNFYPVDQQAPMEPKRRTSKTHSNDTGGASESSSPSLLAGKVSDTPSVVPVLQNRRTPIIQDIGGPQMKRQRTESLSPEAKGKQRDAAMQLTRPNLTKMCQDHALMIMGRHNRTGYQRSHPLVRRSSLEDLRRSGGQPMNHL